MVKDPVCGMMVDEKAPAATTTYKGKTYYSCHENCKKEFDRDPEKFVQRSKQQKNETQN